MKIFLVAAMFLQLCLVEKCTAQNELKDMLRLIERKDSVLLADIKKNTEKNHAVDFQLMGNQIDSLILFVNRQKEMKGTSFENIIVPYIETQLTSWNSGSFNFSDEEELIFDSFMTMLKWEETIETVCLYENFVLRMYKKRIEMKPILEVLAFFKETYNFVKNREIGALNAFVMNKLKEEFENYNTVNRNVFAMNPPAMLLWLTATYAWTEN